MFWFLFFLEKRKGKQRHSPISKDREILIKKTAVKEVHFTDKKQKPTIIELEKRKTGIEESIVDFEVEEVSQNDKAMSSRKGKLDGIPLDELKGEDFSGEINYSSIHGNLLHYEFLMPQKKQRNNPPTPPIKDKFTPLPHNGLFIRRNNTYGTKTNFGIKELIENGVMIDQTNIKFDDFLKSDTKGISGPAKGEGLAINFGTTVITKEQKYHPEATHYLEIALKASDIPLPNQPKTTPIPVNYMFVIDSSGSMEGQKIDLVKQSIRKLFEKLGERDIIGIIEFNTSVCTLLKATPKKEIDLNNFSNIISGIHPSGGTDINLGLSYGIDEIERYEDLNMLNHLFLFSDGHSNSGETNCIKIRQNISNKLKGSIGLSAFGFGSDSNMRELNALVGGTDGQAIFVNHPDDIAATLNGELNKRDYLAAINVQIKMKIDETVSILHFYGHDLIDDPVQRAAVFKKLEAVKIESEEKYNIQSKEDIIIEEDGIRVFTPNLAIGETYWIVLELGLPVGKEIADIGNFEVQYNDIIKRESKKVTYDLSMPPTIPNETVLQHGIELWTSEIAFLYT